MVIDRLSGRQQRQRATSVSTQEGSHPSIGPSSLGLVVAESKAGKSENQDFCATYDGNTLAAIVVADGVGSSRGAESAARLAVQTFTDELSAIDKSGTAVTAAHIAGCWSKTHLALRSLPTSGADRAEQSEPAFQTTLLVLIDAGDRYVISYVGNGSIYYVRGDVNSFRGIRWPWSITNLVTGHAVLEAKTGKDALRHVLDPFREEPPFVLLEHSKDRDCGDVLIVCTDGVSSPEQLRVGYDATEKLWLEVNPHIKCLVEDYVSQLLDESARPISVSALQAELHNFLQKTAFEDDATVGILLSKRVTQPSLVPPS